MPPIPLVLVIALCKLLRNAPRQIDNNLSTEKFRNATPFSFLHLNILIKNIVGISLMKNISFEITLTMAMALITTIIPVSALSPSVPSEVVPSVQDFLQSFVLPYRA